MDRPIRITNILKNMSAEDALSITDLDVYTSDLEAKQPQRPTRIATILDEIESQYPVTLTTTLNDYITGLEATQKADVSVSTLMPVSRTERAPVWGQQKAVERRNRHAQRALRKIHDYK